MNIEALSPSLNAAVALLWLQQRGSPERGCLIKGSLSPTPLSRAKPQSPAGDGLFRGTSSGATAAVGASTCWELGWLWAPQDGSSPFLECSACSYGASESRCLLISPKRVPLAPHFRSFPKEKLGLLLALVPPSCPLSPVQSDLP